MLWPEGMKVVGLTGGIASGKSTVSNMLRELGAQVIDADVVAREVVEPGTPGLKQIAERFPGVIGEDGRLDRAKLGARIFADPEERKALNEIIHPLIHMAVLEKTFALKAAGVTTVIYDAPLLIENGLQHAMDAVILVAAPQDVQVDRLIARNGLSREEALARIASQLPLEKKRPYATWIVENAGSLEETRRQVERIWEAINERQL